MRRPAASFVISLAAAATLAILAVPTAGALTDPTLTQSKRATTDDLDPSRLYSSPDLAVDPRNPRIVVASFADLRSRHCGLLRSTDAGKTWKRLDASPSTPGYPFCMIPDDSNIQAHVAFGRNGTLYYALSGWNVQDGGSAAGTVSVMLGRSDDLGDSWQTVMVDDTRGKAEADREGVRPLTDLVVDTKSGNEDVIYVTWVKQFPGTSGATAKPIQAMVGVSRDGGRTFAPAIRLSDGAFTPEVFDRARASAPPATGAAATAAPSGYVPANFGGDRPTVTVDANGTAYAAWFSVTTSNVSPRPTPGHFFSTSTDQGRTWTATQIAPFDVTNGRGRLKIAWTPTGGPQGSLNLVVEGNRFPDTQDYAEVFRRRSTDGGKTWTDREPLSSDQPGNGRGKYHPNIAVAPNGRVDVIWWDTRDDPGIRGNDVYYVFSEDGGATWSKNIRISDRTVDRRIGVWVFNFDMSTVPSVASTDAYAIFGWDDTRETPPELIKGGSAEPGFGITDIYTAAAQHAPVGAASSDTAAVIAAIALGLVAGVLILVAVLVGRRAGARARPAATTRPARTPAGVG